MKINSNYFAGDEQGYGNPLLHRIYLKVNKNMSFQHMIKGISELATYSSEHDFEINVEIEDTNEQSIKLLQDILEERDKWHFGHELRYPRFRILIPIEKCSSELFRIVNQFDNFYPEIEIIFLKKLKSPLNASISRKIGLELGKSKDYLKGGIFLLFENEESIMGTDWKSFENLINDALKNNLTPYVEIHPSIKFSDMKSSVMTIRTLLETITDLKINLFDCGLLSIARRIAMGFDLGLSPLSNNIIFKCGIFVYNSAELLDFNIRTCYYYIIDTAELTDIVNSCRNCKYFHSCSGCKRSYIHRDMTCAASMEKVIAECNDLLITLYIADAPQMPILQFDWEYLYDSFNGI
jgi:hypothetical protein